MEINKDTILKPVKALYIDKILDKKENKYNEDVYLLYNPDGYGEVLTVGKEVIDFMSKLNGKDSLEQIVNELKLDCNEMKKSVEFLVKKQMIRFEDNLKNDAKIWKRELTCWMHLTNDCNLACKYCYIHKSHDCMKDELLYYSIDKMADSCIKNNYMGLTLMLVGGEPMTMWDKIVEIINYCKKYENKLEVKFHIPTNGTLITPERAKYIHENNIDVGVSLDGTQRYHDINRIKRNGIGSYKDAIKGIDNLIANYTKPAIMNTVTNQNLEGLPDFTKEMIDKKIFFRFSFERDTQTGRPAILDNQERVIEVLNKCFDIMENSLKQEKVGWYFQFGDVHFRRPVRRACGAGGNFFALSQDGRIASCSLGLENPAASIYEIDDVITYVKETFKDLSQTSARDVEECGKCTWRHSCAGACPLQTYATYKTYMHISPYCNIYKECLPRVLKIKAMNIYFKNKINMNGGIKE